MELKDLKQNWQNSSNPSRTQPELLKMTKVANRPAFKKVRRKLVIETLFMIILLVVYYDWFDGHQKPFYANFSLVVGMLLYIANDIIGYYSMTALIRDNNLKISIRKYLGGVKRLSIFSLITSSLFAISIIVFFTSTIHFTREKWFILLGIVLILVQMMHWSFRIWKNRIRALSQQMKDIDYDEQI